MKKFFVFFAALGAFLAVSCNEELKIDVNPAQPEMRTVTLTACIQDEGTKTSYSAGEGSTLLFSWSTGDQISVLCSDAAFHTFTAETVDGKQATFTATLEEGVNPGDRAYFPADANHTADSYNLPYYKDVTSHPSADIPMFGTKDGSGKFNFAHCAGAALITIENIPDGITSATISVTSNNSSDASQCYKLSGLFYIHTTGPKWDGAYASTANEKVYSRKVSVSSNTAKLYLPCPAGANNWVPSLLNVTGHSSGGDVVLYSDKSMKALGTVERAHVKPLTPLVYVQLGSIDWSKVDMYPDDAAEYFPGTASRVIGWKVKADSKFIYFYLKYNKSDAISNGTSNYIEMGFDTDNDPDTGDAASYVGKVEAFARLYPVTNYADDTFTFGVGGSSKVECPVGTKTGNPSHLGNVDSSYVYAEIAIERAKIGASASGTIGVKISVRSEAAAEQTITLP